jgi:Secretion system C-terminal sorting domain
VWRIHTLIYDPATLDLSVVNFGVTSAYDVLPLLQQGGGSICASLDVNGAPTKTGICELICTADAGTISADQSDLCLTNGTALLFATPDGNANVPVGYQTAYVLTQGTGLVIVNAGAAPAFVVNAPGIYTIHTLVLDTASIDLGGVVLGVTTGFDVNALLIQGGGSICASLDVTGAEFQVIQCAPTCDAFAGALSADSTQLCLVNGIATMTAVPNGDAVVPAGYSVLYVLTRGPELFIQNAEPTPSFEWPLTGDYTIHTLVYDPNTLDLSGIQFDVTTGFDVNALLIQGGGSICGSLDVAGVQFTITECAPPCNAGDGANVLLCFNGPVADLISLLGGSPCQNGTWIGADGQATTGVFDPSTDPAGVYIYAVIDNNGGIDTTAVIVDLVECPGNAIAYGHKEEPLDNGGVATSVAEQTTQPLSVWPNPVIDVVNVSLNHAATNSTRVEVLDGLGRTVAVPVEATGTRIALDVRSLAAGPYVVRVNDDVRSISGRFVRAER